MKTKIFTMLLLGLSVTVWAQKDEIKDANKAMKSGNFASVVTELNKAASTIESADAKMQAQYFNLLGEAYAGLAKAGDTDAYRKAFDAYNRMMDIEKESGKARYTDDAATAIQQMTADLINAAIKDQNESKFVDSATKLYLGYKMSPKDTVYLYYAAGSSVNGGDLEGALKYYRELKEVGYDGSGITYTAVNVETGKTEELDKDTRDLYVKSGSYTNPKDEKIPSKKAEIVKNIALILQQQGKTDEALQAYEDAMAANPEDVNLVLNKANLYYNMGDKETFKKLMEEASQMAPDNPDLLYNIGVINMEQGDYEGARAAYSKALEIDPNYTNALLNLSTTYVNEGNDLIEEMNELSSSYKKEDIAKYDKLKEQKDDLFREGAKVLEAALKDNPNDKSILSQLKNLYGALGDTDNFKRVKGMLGE